MDDPARTTVKHVPRGLKKIDERTLGIEWSDGATTTYVVRRLRQLCPCAKCVDEMTGVRTLDPATIGEDVHPRKIEPVGKYALHLEWSDGHATGIYTYVYLRRIAEAEADEQTPTDA